jgi:hypothetical protein
VEKELLAVLLLREDLTEGRFSGALLLCRLRGGLCCCCIDVGGEECCWLAVLLEERGRVGGGSYSCLVRLLIN